MKRSLEAACWCHTGRVRRSNEDNVFFDGKCLEQENNGLKHPVYMDEPVRNGICLAVFDGMGVEESGRVASFAAARQLQQLQRSEADYIYSGKSHLNDLVSQMNTAVWDQREGLGVEVLGTTMVALFFSAQDVYVCNVGSCKAYRMRGGEFLQLSRNPEQSENAARYLGSAQQNVKPYIARGELQQGDRYLICSDGLTEMLSNFEISDILIRHRDVGHCVTELIGAALEHGGRDNVTAIVCDVV